MPGRHQPPGDRALPRRHRGSALWRCCSEGPRRSELDLLEGQAVERWVAQHQPTVVVLAAAKVGVIAANSSYPADFLLDNLKIQTHVIETAWRSGAEPAVPGQQLHLPEVRRAADQRGISAHRGSRAQERVVRHRQDHRHQAVRCPATPARL